MSPNSPEALTLEASFKNADTNPNETVFVQCDIVHPNPWNAGRGDDAEMVEKMAQSIKAVRQLQSAILRPHPNLHGEYEIVAGELRWRACMSLGFLLMARVCELTDAEAMEVTLAENMMRKASTPWEQAQALSRLLDLGWDVAECASHLGESPVVLRMRAKLLDLAPCWLENRDVGLFSKWTTAHFERIARFAEEVQVRLFVKLDGMGLGEWNGHFLNTVEGLERWLADQSHALSLAPWHLDDAVLNAKAGACSACPKRTDHQADLFGEAFSVGAKDRAGGRCLDAACWELKLRAQVLRSVAEQVEEHGACRKVSTRQTVDMAEGDVMAEGEYTIAKKKGKGVVAGVMIDGPQAGTKVWVKPEVKAAREDADDDTDEDGEGGEAADEGGRSYGGSSGSVTQGKRGRGRPPAPSLAERRKALEAQRHALALENLRNWVEADEPGYDWTPEAQAIAAKFLLVFGGHHRLLDHDPYDKKACAMVMDYKKPVDIKTMRESFVKQAAGEIFGIKNNLHADSDLKATGVNHPTAKLVAWMFGADLDALKAAADKACPEPATWAKEK